MPIASEDIFFLLDANREYRIQMELLKGQLAKSELQNKELQQENLSLRMKLAELQADSE